MSITTRLIQLTTVERDISKEWQWRGHVVLYCGNEVDVQLNLCQDFTSLTKFNET
jgi:hypothetical protein